MRRNYFIPAVLLVAAMSMSISGCAQSAAPEKNSASDVTASETAETSASSETAEAAASSENAEAAASSKASEAEETLAAEEGAEVLDGLNKDAIEPSLLDDGQYTAYFETDSSMFYVSEACDGKGMLAVKNGEMTIHVSLSGHGILNLYAGTADEAKADEAGWLNPTEDEVTFSDGMTEKVNGFDIPVPVLDEEFDVALIGKKGKWYDHKVKVSLAEDSNDTNLTAAKIDLRDGVHEVEVSMEGGTGRASILSPAELDVEDGKSTLVLTWSSENYDYMIVDGEKYLNENEGGNSTFVIPLGEDFDISAPLVVIGDTTAMSEPHEVEYTLHFKLAD